MDNKAKAIELINKLSDEQITKLYNLMQFSKLHQILGKQPIPDVVQSVLDYVVTFKDTEDSTLLMIDVFNYGKIYGIRQERARRSRFSAPGTSGTKRPGSPTTCTACL